MSVLDFLDGASFRGVPFVVPERSLEGGRRGESSEQPNADVPRTQDMGRKAKSFRITAWVMADSGFGVRNRLVDALDAYGPGRYVDPWGRQYIVKVARWSVRESTKTANLVEFQIEFEEHGAQPLAVASRADTNALLRSAAATLWADARAAFAGDYAFRGVLDYVRQAGPAVIGSYAGEILSDIGAWGIDAADSLGLSDAVAEMTGSAASVEAIADGVRLGVSLAADLIPTTSARTRFLLRTAQFAVAPVALPWATESRTLEAQNEVATAALVRRAGLASIAETTPTMTWSSYDEARDYMHAMGDTFDGEISSAGGSVRGESSSSVFASLASARAALVSDVDARSSSLARLTSVTLTGSRPAVVEAYRQYDDATRASDLIARNGLSDPNRMPSGVALEYLSQ